MNDAFTYKYASASTVVLITDQRACFSICTVVSRILEAYEMIHTEVMQLTIRENRHFKMHKRFIRISFRLFRCVTFQFWSVGEAHRNFSDLRSKPCINHIVLQIYRNGKITFSLE